MAVRTMGTSGQPFTYADLEDMPDDGRRYELSYGALVVTPAPSLRHQRLVTRLIVLLDAQCPEGREVLAGAELRLQDDLLKIPDLMVVASALVDGQSITGTPDLVVEIHSPSTKVLDLTEKRAVYAAAGIPSYWLVDPEAETVTALELRDGAYVEVQTTVDTAGIFS